MQRKLTLILAGLIVSSWSVYSTALPRFTAKVEQKCNLCHVSPTGGGMRNAFGSQYFAMTEMAVHKTALDQISKFQPYVSDNISLGLDMRSMYVYDDNTGQSSFFQMQGSFYVSAQLNDRFSVTFDKGLYGDAFEIYGMGYILPYEGCFRVGKFLPSYGWQFDDHTSFVREKMVWIPGYSDTGFELGIYPYGISASVGFFNGSNGQFDGDKGKAVSGRMELRKHISNIGLGGGGSVYMNDTPARDITMFGPLYYLSLGKFIYMGEADWLENRPLGVDAIKSFAMTQQVCYMITQGVWINGTYDFHDPDTDLKNGALTRYGLGINYFPYGFLEIQPNIHIYDDDIETYVQYDGQFHFFF